MIFQPISREMEENCWYGFLIVTAQDIQYTTYNMAKHVYVFDWPIFYLQSLLIIILNILSNTFELNSH